MKPLPPIPQPALILIMAIPISVVLIWLIVGFSLPPAYWWGFFSFLFQ